MPHVPFVQAALAVLKPGPDRVAFLRGPTNRQWMLLYVAAAALLLVVIVISANRTYDNRLRVVAEAAHDTANELGNFVKSGTDQVGTLRNAMQEALQTPQFPTRTVQAYQRMAPSRAFAGFALDQRDDASEVANITGSGAIPAMDSAKGQEILAALQLGSFLSIAWHSAANASWVYYTSANGFITAYPWAASEKSHFDAKYLDYSFFTLGRPVNNPGRTIFWTEAYIDGYGQGLMSTIGAPVYDAAGSFRGTVALDVTLTSLGAYLDDRDQVDGEEIVINDQGQIITSKSDEPVSATTVRLFKESYPDLAGGDAKRLFDAVPDRRIANISGHIVYVAALKAAPWHLVYIADRSRLGRHVFWSMLADILGFGLFLALLFAFELRRRASVILSGHNQQLEEAQSQLQEQTTSLQHLATELTKALGDAEHANTAKSSMLANVSHELRTPLNAIIGFSEVMKLGVFGALGAPQYEAYAHDIHDSGKLLLALINDLLDISKIEAGRYTLAPEHCALEELITAATRLVQDRATEAELQLLSHITPQTPDLYADHRAALQILTNLLTNAIKFTPKGGKVTISVAPAILIDGEPAFVVLTVSDTGIGIAEADIPQVLSAFGQVDNALSRQHEGTGLGLPIVKALVEMHGGKLEIDSVVGKGTDVRVTLPAAADVA